MESPYVKILALSLALLLAPAYALAGSNRVLVQSTTSTDNSGFYDYILPLIKADTGLQIDVVAVGTGQAIRNAMNGDADVLLVHSRPDEDAFVAAGYGLERFDLMYNDFVFVGPENDPAGLTKASGLADAIARLAKSTAPFVSRGDDSGTDKKERALWRVASLQPPTGKPWYREAGAGMGATLRMAIEMRGYTLSDRATWLAYGDKQGTKIVFEGDPALFNPYGIIALNPARFPHVNAEGAKQFVDWMLSGKGQNAIAAFKVNGTQLFFPDAITSTNAGNP